jgi:DNA-binding MarR family transcriptional regulator
MTDPIPSPPAIVDNDVRRGVELLYFGYSRLTRVADERLAAQGLGRAHQRVLYFVSRQPGLTVSELLKLLGITKQSLSRVLSELTRRGLVEVRTCDDDRRQRRLHLSAEGQVQEAALFNDLSTKLRAAYGEAGSAALPGFWAVLASLVPDEERDMVRALQSHSD